MECRVYHDLISMQHNPLHGIKSGIHLTAHPYFPEQVPSQSLHPDPDPDRYPGNCWHHNRHPLCIQ